MQDGHGNRTKYLLLICIRASVLEFSHLVFSCARFPMYDFSVPCYENKDNEGRAAMKRGPGRVVRMLHFSECSRNKYRRRLGGVGYHQTTVSCAQGTDPELQEHRIDPPSVLCKRTIVAFSTDHGTMDSSNKR